MSRPLAKAKTKTEGGNVVANSNRLLFVQYATINLKVSREEQQISAGQKYEALLTIKDKNMIIDNQ